MNIDLIIKACKEKDIKCRELEKRKDEVVSFGYEDGQKLAEEAVQLFFEMIRQENSVPSHQRMRYRKHMKSLVELLPVLVESTEIHYSRNKDNLKKIKSEVEQMKVQGMTIEQMLYIDISTYLTETMENTGKIKLVSLNQEYASLEPRVKAAQDKLREMISLMGAGIRDAGSEQACKYAKDIVKYIKTWRKAAFQKLLTDDSILDLDRALVIMHKWVELPTTRKVSEKGVLGVRDDIVAADDYRHLMKIADIAKRSEQFFIILEARESDLMRETSTRTKIEEVRQMLATIEATADGYVTQERNGVISHAEAIRLVNALDREEATLKSRLRSLEATAQAIETNKFAVRQLITDFGRLRDFYYEFLNRDPTMFINMFYEIEYGSFVSVLSGHPTIEEIASVETYLTSQIEILRVSSEAMTDISKHLELPLVEQGATAGSLYERSASKRVAQDTTETKNEELLDTIIIDPSDR